jgi:DNA-binding transcriptional LysR family regulator
VKFDWDDLRFFLGVARVGSTLGAAAELGTSQPTVVRRICALEEAVGLPLFERSPAGYALTEAGLAMLPLAERVAASVQSVADMLACRRNESHGRIRLTLPTAIEDLLLPLLQRFRADWPNVQVQILASDRHLDLARGEADLAVRVGPLPDTEALFARPLPAIAWTVYASRELAKSRLLPASPGELARFPLIGGEDRVAALPAFQWLDRVAPGAEIVLRCNSLSGVQSAVRTGIGLGLLPCVIGGSDPALLPCYPPTDELRVPFSIVVRRELRRLPHVHALFEGIAAHLHAQAKRLCGDA